MHRRAAFGNLSLLVALAASSQAHADDVVLTPLLPERGVSSDNVGDLFSLFSSEMEFMSTVDQILEVRTRPPSLTTSCLKSSRCLSALTSEAGGNALLGGRVESLGDDFVLDLVYFADGGIARRNTYTVPKAPTPLVNAITPVLVEMLTGVSPVDEQQESQMSGVSFDDEDEDDFAFSPEPEPEPARDPEPEPEPSYGTRTRNERIVAPPEPEPEPEYDDFDPDAFDLGVGSAEEIEFGSVEDDEVLDRPSYGDDEDLYLEDDPPPPASSRRPSRSSSRRVDLDGPTEPDRSASSQCQARKEAPEGYEFRRVYLTARGGLSRYGIFTFGSAGAELAVRASGGLTISVGIQAYIVRRAVDTAGTIDTNFIFPINVGLLYRFKEGKFQPYLGADFVFTQLLRDAQTGQNSFAFGGRVRGGFDYFFVPQVGLNVDIGLGVLAGEDWEKVDSRLAPIGFYPTGTVGFTFAF